MHMTTRERLLAIPEIKIEQVLIKMKDNELYAYIQILNLFVEKFPLLETEMKKTLEALDYPAFSRCLAVMRDMLKQIFAEDMAAECQKQIDELINIKHEKVEAHMNFFLSMLAMLSIDIQMAVYKDDGDDDKGEAYSDADAEDEAKPGGAGDAKTGGASDAKTGGAKTGGAKGAKAFPAVASEPGVAGQKGILAVDDNTFFLDTLKRVLHDTDYKLTCVTSGIAALRFLQNHRPDLFILDIEMPVMDGYELSRKIRAYGKKAPIIFLTGNAKREYVLKAIEAGASDFIIKPINQKHVLERIAKFI